MSDLSEWFIHNAKMKAREELRAEVIDEVKAEIKAKIMAEVKAEEEIKIVQNTIKQVVSIKLEDGKTEDEIVNYLMEKYSLSKEDANKAFEQYS